MTDVDLAPLADAAQLLSRALRRAGERQVGLDPLPGSELEVLQHVIAHPGVAVSAVARALHLQTSNVSTTVRALVQRGLVERTPDPTDHRRSLLQPSEAAVEHRRLLEAAWHRAITAALADLEPADAATIRQAAPALSRLAQALSR